MDQRIAQHLAAQAAAAQAQAKAKSPFASGATPFPNPPAASPARDPGADCMSGVDADDDSSDADPAATPSLATLRLIAQKWPQGVTPELALQIATDPELRQALHAQRAPRAHPAKRPCPAARAYLPTDDEFDG